MSTNPAELDSFKNSLEGYKYLHKKIFHHINAENFF
jgi:hypothetical protein